MLPGSVYAILWPSRCSEIPASVRGSYGHKPLAKSRSLVSRAAALSIERPLATYFKFEVELTEVSVCGFTVLPASGHEAVGRSGAA